MGESFKFGRPERQWPDTEPAKTEQSAEPAKSERTLKEHYKPRFFKAGGEHVVYEIAESPNVLIKVNKKSIVDTVNMKDGSNSENKTPEDLLQIERARLTKLKVFFGDHVIQQKKFLMNIPLNQEIKNDLESQYWEDLGNREEVRAIVTIQPKSDLFENPTAQSVTSGLAERWMKPGRETLRDYPEVVEAYNRNTNVLLNAEMAATAKLDEKEFLAVYRSEKLFNLYKKAKEDEGFKAQLEDLLSKAIDFANETGEIIDIQGADNILIYQDEQGKWDYKLFDPLYLYPPLTIAKEGYKDKTLSRDDKAFNASLQAVNFTRAVNGLSNLLGFKKFYSLLPKNEDGTLPDMSKEWWYMMAPKQEPIPEDTDPKSDWWYPDWLKPEPPPLVYVDRSSLPTVVNEKAIPKNDPEEQDQDGKVA